MQSFYDQLFNQTQFQHNQVAALARLTRLSNDNLRSLAGYIIWSIWN